MYNDFPAVAGKVVYALNAGQLHALNSQDGNLLWNFIGDTELKRQPVVTANRVYVTSGNHTYAVNLTTHEADVTLDGGGWLAVAHGRLFVSRSDGQLSVWKFAN